MLCVFVVFLTWLGGSTRSMNWKMSSMVMCWSIMPWMASCVTVSIGVVCSISNWSLRGGGVSIFVERFSESIKQVYIGQWRNTGSVYFGFATYLVRRDSLVAGRKYVRFRMRFVLFCLLVAFRFFVFDCWKSRHVIVKVLVAIYCGDDKFPVE